MAPRHPAAMPPPPGLSAGPDATSLLKAVRRRWLLTLSVGILAAVAALAAVMLLLPTKYVAFSTLQVASNPVTFGTPKWNNDFKVVLQTMAARFKSRDVVLKTLSQDQVRELWTVRRFPSTLATIAWLEEEIKVETQDMNELMSVSLPGEDAEELCILVNALTDSYLKIVQDKERGLRRERVKKIQAIAFDINEKLGTKIVMRSGLLKDGVDPNSPAGIMRLGSMQNRRTEAFRQLALATFEAEKAKAKLAAHSKLKKEITLHDIPDTVIIGTIESEGTIKPKLLQIQNLEKNLSRLDFSGHQPNDPTRRSLMENINKLRREVDATREGLKDDLLDRYQHKINTEHKQMHEALQHELEPLVANAKTLQENFDQIVQETDTFRGTGSKLDLLNHDIKQLEEEKKSVAQQLTELEVQEQQLTELEVQEQAEWRVTLAQEAVWQVKDAKKRLMLMGAAPLAAFALAAFGIGWWEFRARRIHSADEIALGLGVRVVGAVPVSARRQFVTPLAAAAAEDHNLIESIDSIRTTLLRNASVEPTQVVMVTSAVAGEGKTTLSSSLAASLARAGRRTLLVDCDLRSPTLHQLFEQTLQPGFSEVVLGEVELPDAVRPTTTDDNLWLLPAGQWDREVVQELARDSVGAIFERLKQEFDFVVIDSHPVLPATDSLLIGQHVDAVILSVLRGVSQTPRVHTAHERLATLGIRLFGAVVNGMPSEPYARRQQERQPAATAAA
jgi:capsular exopolysaccharide synthesis family protein